MISYSSQIRVISKILDLPRIGGVWAIAMKLISGNSNRALSEAISSYLDVPLTQCNIRRFNDMEVFVEIMENVRGQDTFFIQSTSFPANDHLMELLIAIDALKRGSAKRITAVILLPAEPLSDLNGCWDLHRCCWIWVTTTWISVP